ncbi:MAG: hypothetical protein LUI13_02030 [Lachnospiraceae bacterium]|nr:hypothetical protein [Lachnospiraceae bacterium]
MEKEQNRKQQEASEALPQEKQPDTPKEASAEPKAKLSETWAQDTIADIDEFIESQGIYLRQ